MALAAVQLKCVSPEKSAKVLERLQQIARNYYRKTTRNMNLTRLSAVLTGGKISATALSSREEHCLAASVEY